MKVAEPTVERLIQYYRLLIQMKEEERKVVSSLQIGEILGIKASQVRKDLSYFGEIGKRGVGYHVNRLCLHIENILASPKVWKVALAGVGNLGTALMGHAAFQSYKFEVDALFDVDPEKVGHEIMGVRCWHVDEIAKVMEERGIEVLILAVPASAAQNCVDKAVLSSSLKGILAFTPATVVVPEKILFYRVDIFVELEKLLFFLKEREEKH
ncbi:MAG TPA: redox-sensing transcriptional repressor Rex [Synergistaceae bacterium]|jgi:redox-sensing transcriptional repressor|uniref:redox-sensing transcriptional repressor Rex n=1 Tax=Synergistaceae TaxID=649777 RepID=UPI000EB842AB|nr:redox-sensing transcriptional repressor Rex [Synergistaceae bacterium DZ-S4]HAH70130.1 redox-sensing transcriptional repressor Rex [Synergistaceae bacterium]